MRCVSFFTGGIIFILTAYGCQVLTLEESRKKSSAKFLGCSETETTVTGDFTKTWTATCKQKSYYCSAQSSGVSGQVECLEITVIE